MLNAGLVFQRTGNAVRSYGHIQGDGPSVLQNSGQLKIDHVLIQMYSVVGLVASFPNTLQMPGNTGC